MIKLSKSSISITERKAVDDVLQREFLGMGVEVDNFEKQLSSLLNRPVVALSNGTSALQLALQACGIGYGDEVIVPTLTYVASFQAITATGATAVACDINSDNLILDCDDVEKRITKKTKAIMPVYYGGAVGDIQRLQNIVEKHSLRMIVDAAHAFGTKINGQLIGSFGDITCFSFDGIKNITCGEGGCVVTNDLKVIEQVKDMRLLGVNKDSDNRYLGKRTWEFDVFEQGWRYHMSNIMAAIGIEQLKRKDEFFLKRQSIAKFYDELIGKDPKIITLKNDYSQIVPHIYVVKLVNTISRDVVREKLNNLGIQTGIHYQLNHKLTYFSKKEVLPFPNAEKIFPQILSLPIHVDLNEIEVQFVVKSLKQIVYSH